MSMKKIILFAALVLGAFVMNAQNLEPELNTLNEKLATYDYTVQNGTVVMQKVVEVSGMSASQLYSAAKNFVISTYNSPNHVIQNDDAVNGHLIVKGLFETTTCDCGDIVFWGSAMEYTPNHILKFDVKDEKIRITVITSTIKQKSGGNSYVPLQYIDYSVSQLYPISRNVDVYSTNHAMNFYPKEGSKKQYQGFLHEGYVLYRVLQKMEYLLMSAQSACLNTQEIESENDW